MQVLLTEPRSQALWLGGDLGSPQGPCSSTWVMSSPLQPLLPKAFLGLGTKVLSPGSHTRGAQAVKCKPSQFLELLFMS